MRVTASAGVSSGRLAVKMAKRTRSSPCSCRRLAAATTLWRAARREADGGLAARLADDADRADAARAAGLAAATAGEVGRGREQLAAHGEQLLREANAGRDALVEEDGG